MSPQNHQKGNLMFTFAKSDIMYFIQSQSTNRHKVLGQSAINLPTCAKEGKHMGNTSSGTKLNSWLKMAPWEFHKKFATLDVKGILSYPNHYSPKWLEYLPIYDGDASLAIPHIVNFLRYISDINVSHEDVMVRLFIYSFEMEQRDWVRYYGGPKSITSMALFFEIFLKHWGPPCQDYKSALNDHLVVKISKP
jgi:hypothetical protein